MFSLLTNATLSIVAIVVSMDVAFTVSGVIVFELCS